MERNGRDTPVSMPILLVRASLPNLDETEGQQDGDDFARLENRKARQWDYATVTS